MNRPNRQRFSFKGSATLAASHNVFDIETVSDDVDMPAAFNTNGSPNRRDIFSEGSV
jgi:hypothetical protein